MKMIFKMAYRNIGRNRRRSALTMSTVFMVVLILIFFQAYFQGMFNQLVDVTARFTTGHLKVYPKGYADKEILMPLDLAIVDSGSALARVMDVGQVEKAARRIKFHTMAQRGGQEEFPVLMGLEPEAEKGIIELDKNLALGRYFESGKREAIVGLELAKKLGVVAGPGAEFTPGEFKLQILAPRGIPITFSVVGVSRFGYGMIDDGFIFIPFPDAQYAADFELDDMASEILVLIADRERAMEAADEVREAISGVADMEYVEVLPWQAQGWLYQMIESSSVAIGVILFILFFIAGATVVNTMLMAVMERTREIGMLKAMGMKGAEIVGLVGIEAFMIGVFGGVAGAAAGVAVSMLLESTGIPIGEAAAGMDIPIGESLRVDFMWHMVPASFLFGLAVAVISSLWPAIKAAKLSPTEALRTI